MSGTRFAALLTAVPLLFGLRATGFTAPKPELWPKWTAHNAQSPARVNHDAWDRFLKIYVVANHASWINRVRYKAVTPEDRRGLKNYLKMLQGVQMAYWINLYNALTLKVILDYYPVRSIRDIDISPGWFQDRPWSAKLARVEGEDVTLDDIEHRILRPIWKDDRVHYAVNCASLGCPNLQPEAFTSDNVEVLLEKGAREYINHPRGDESRTKPAYPFRYLQVVSGRFPGVG